MSRAAAAATVRPAPRTTTRTCPRSSCSARGRTLAVPGLGNASSTWLAAAATVKVYVGGQQPGMAVKAPSNVLSAEIEVAGKEVPLSAC